MAIPATHGNLDSASLALLALIAIRTGRTGALALVRIFNVVGTVDLIYALTKSDAVPDLGAA